MRLVFVGVVLCAVLSPVVAIAAPIVFGDAGLELLVRAAIDEEAGEIDDQDPRLAQVLSIQSGPLLIDDLTGVEFLVNLEVLSLPDNRVADLAPLSGLVALRELNLARNRVADLTPLAGLTDLEILDLTANSVASVEPLDELRGLVELRLGMNTIAQIGALAGLDGPAVLELQDNSIRDASPLLNVSQFPTGATVDLRGNPLSTNSLCSVVLPLQEDGVNVLADGECPGIIVGTITDAANGLPVPCAIVIAEPPVGAASIGPTDLSGEYQLDGLPPGVSTLRIFAPTYTPEAGQGTVVSSSQRRISFDLARQSITGFRNITGQVTDAVSGASLAGVMIEATSGQGRLGETFSCADGNYQLLINPNITIATITYSAIGYMPMVVDLSNGEPGDIALTPTAMHAGNVSGRVFDGRVRPVSGLSNARVTVKAEGAAVAYSTRTNTLGEYTIANLPLDIYTVRVSSASIRGEFSQQSIELGGTLENIEFTLGTFVEPPEEMGCPDRSLAPAQPSNPASGSWALIIVALATLSRARRRRALNAA